MATVQLKNVSKRYKGQNGNPGVLALNDLSFALDENEIVALIGRSGCGKSTAMNLIAGFDSPTSGSSSINGHTVAGPQQCGIVFQADAIFPWMTVKENIAYSPIMNNFAPERAELQVARYLQLVGLADCANSWRTAKKDSPKCLVTISSGSRTAVRFIFEFHFNKSAK